MLMMCWVVGCKVAKDMLSCVSIKYEAALRSLGS